MVAGAAFGLAATFAISAPGAHGSPAPTSPGAVSLPGAAPAPVITAPPGRHAKGRWLRGVTITEYWPAPESWFVGRLVSAPGLNGLHRIDWLYSASGISMQGEGIGLDGQLYHLANAGAAGWVSAAGRSTSAADGWSAGAPYWRAGAFWRNRRRQVTFPLSSGGWSNGLGLRYVRLPQISFAQGPSAPLRPLQSIAVDPRVIALGSRVYVPAYRHDGHGGWFLAQDTGGGVAGQHIDVYRLPPASSQDPGRYLRSQRIFVIAPKR